MHADFKTGRVDPIASLFNHLFGYNFIIVHVGMLRLFVYFLSSCDQIHVLSPTLKSFSSLFFFCISCARE